MSDNILCSQEEYRFLERLYKFRPPLDDSLDVSYILMIYISTCTYAECVCVCARVHVCVCVCAYVHVRACVHV